MINTIISLSERRELLWQFLTRNIKSRHRGSVLGAAWLVFNPLLMLSLYVFAFGVVFGGRFTDSPEESTLDFALGVFLGLNVLGLIQSIIGSAPTIIVAQPNFVKVVFPLEILPAATMGALAYDLLIGFGLCLLGVVTLGPGLSGTVFYVPLIIARFSYGPRACMVPVCVGSIHSGYWTNWFFPGSLCSIRAVSFIQPKRQRRRHWQSGNFFNGIHSFRSSIP